MEIERKQQPCIGQLKTGSRGTNEYKNRPVLPTAEQVIKDDKKQNYPGLGKTLAGEGSNSAALRRPR